MQTQELVLNTLFFIISILALYKGSDILVTGTSKTAARLGVSSLIISLTIVAYGTSAPELATSVIAALDKHTNLAIGNIIGSCFANILLILGISSIIRPISVSTTIVRRELPILLLATTLFTLLAYFDLLNRVGGFILLTSFTFFLLYFIKAAQKERRERSKEKFSLPKGFTMISLGIGGVVIGAYLLVSSSVFFARWFGVPEFIIAVSMVAVGTSIPELAVSAVAAWKREGDISVGNLLGSNVFNILLIIGICSVILKLPVSHKALISSFFLVGITLFLFPILYTGKRVSRIEGIFLITIYAFYLWYIF